MQEFICVNIDKGQYLKPEDYEKGSNILEHAYIGSEFMNAVETILVLKKWRTDRIVWAGSKMDNYIHLGKFVKESSILEAEENGVELQLYQFALDHFERIAPYKNRDEFGCYYLVNHTKKEYVDKIDENNGYWKVSNVGRVIHPLALLLASGNGRGRLDYEGTSMELVGSWAGDRISTQNSLPDDDYIKIETNFSKQ